MSCIFFLRILIENLGLIALKEIFFFAFKNLSKYILTFSFKYENYSILFTQATQPSNVKIFNRILGET
jgi:hypothetical protein